MSGNTRASPAASHPSRSYVHREQSRDASLDGWTGLPRHQAPLLRELDPVTETAIRTIRRSANRYEHDRPGSLIRINVKKLGRIPDGFLEGTIAFFAGVSVTVERVITDSALAYRHSAAFTDVLAAHSITQKFIKPHYPSTNGTVERLNRTLATEWAYDQPWTSNAERAAALPCWLGYYNLTEPTSASAEPHPSTESTTVEVSTSRCYRRPPGAVRGTIETVFHRTIVACGRSPYRFDRLSVWCEAISRCISSVAVAVIGPACSCMSCSRWLPGYLPSNRSRCPFISGSDEMPGTLGAPGSAWGGDSGRAR